MIINPSFGYMGIHMSLMTECLVIHGWFPIRVAILKAGAFECKGYDDQGMVIEV